MPSNQVNIYVVRTFTRLWTHNTYNCLGFENNTENCLDALCDSSGNVAL